MTNTAFDLAAVSVRRARTDELGVGGLAAIRSLLDAAFAPDDPFFPESDWLHALGGVHFVALLDDAVAAHASVVPRELLADGRPLRTGYVEAVATLPALQGRGIGTLAMRAANEHIRSSYELGALGTGEHGFYARLGWRTWAGRTYVRQPDGEPRRTPDEDGGIMVLETPSTPGPLDLGAPLTCDWREGDVW
jgi:aminoglycoside 2'-N-acetyltransferase I